MSDEMLWGGGGVPETPQGLNLVSKKTVAGANATTVTFDNLDLQPGDHFTIVGGWKNTSLVAKYLSAYINGDDTATNYRYETSGSQDGVSIDTGASAGLIANNDGNSHISLVIEGHITLDGNVCLFTQSIKTSSNASRNISLTSTWKVATVASITQIDLTASSADGIEINSEFKLFKWS